jgi:hypothetical protein
MSSFTWSLASSFGRRPVVALSVAAGLLAWQASLATGVGKADSAETSAVGAKLGQASRGDGTIGTLQPVAFQMAASGALDSSAATVPGPESGAGSGRAWRPARPRLRLPTAESSSSLSQVSFATVSDEAVQGDAMFLLSRSVVPLLTPPTLAASAYGPVGETDMLRGAPVGGKAPVRFRSAARFR